MKLRLVNRLTEADVERGRFLLLIENINKIIKDDVERHGYIFSDKKEKGFYILPKFGYLAKIRITKDDSKLKVSYFTANDATTEHNLGDFTGESFKAAWTEQICPAVIQTLITGDQKEIEQLNKESMTEFLPNVFTSIKNMLDKKAASKEQNIKLIVDECRSILEQKLKDAGDYNKVSIKVNIKDNSTVEFLLNSKFIIGVIYDVDTSIKLTNNKNILKVSGYITNFKERKNLNYSLATFIRFLNRKLGLTIKIKDAQMLATTGSSAAEISKVNDYETDLRTILGDEILSILGEKLSEAFDDTNVIQKYDNALKQIKNDDQGQSLVKLYFYRESGKKVKLKDIEAAEVYNTVAKTQSFRPDKSLLLKIITNYYNRNSNSPTISDEINDLITILVTDNFIRQLKNIKDSSILYQTAFVLNDIPSTTLHDIYSKYVDVLRYARVSEIEPILVRINKELNIDIPEKGVIKKVTTLAEFMVFKDLNKTALRDISTINKIYDIINDTLYGSNRRYWSQSTQTRPNSSQKQNNTISQTELDKIKKLFTDIDNQPGEDPLITLSKKIQRADQKTKNILAQLLSNILK